MAHDICAVSVGILHASFADTIQNLKCYVCCGTTGRDQNIVHRASATLPNLHDDMQSIVSCRNTSKLVRTKTESPATIVSKQKDIAQIHSERKRAHTEFHSATTLSFCLAPEPYNNGLRKPCKVPLRSKLTPRSLTE